MDRIRNMIISFLFQKNKDKKDKEEKSDKSKKQTIIIEEPVIEKEENKEDVFNDINDKNDILETSVKEEYIEKKEISEELIEKTVVEKMENIVKENINQIEDIEYDLNIIKNEKEEIIPEEEKTQDIKQQLVDISSKLEKTKDVYYKDDNNIINDQNEQDETIKENINDLVEEYKNNLKEEFVDDTKQNENTSIEQEENSIGTFEKIVRLENETDKLDVFVDEKVNELNIDNVEFQKTKENYTDIEKVNSVINDFNEQQEKIISEISKKIEKNGKVNKEIEKSTQYVTQFSKLIEASIYAAISKKIPRTIGGNFLRAAFIISAISCVTQFIQSREKQKTVYKVEYTDYTKDIQIALNNTAEMISKIDNAQEDIKYLRKKIQKDYSDYIGQFDYINELFDKIDKAEDELVEKRKKAIKYNEKYGKVMESNKQKIKSLKEIEKQN